MRRLRDFTVASVVAASRHSSRSHAESFGSWIALPNYAISHLRQAIGWSRSMQSEKGNTAYASTTSFVFAFTGEMEMLTRLRLWTITRDARS